MSRKSINNTLTDEVLMDLICRGNREALELVYERYFDKLCWYARGFLKDEAAAEDVVQEVFFKLIENAKSFDSQKRLSTWIYTLTANRCKNLLRDELNRQRILLEQRPDELLTPSFIQQMDAKRIKVYLDSWIEQLSEKEQALFRLRFEQDLPIVEIALILNIPEGSVKSGLFYLIKKINTPLMKQLYEK